MSEEDARALEAARLYAEDATFKDIAGKLEISPSYAQALVRRGIGLMQSEDDNPDEFTEENPSPGGDHQGGGHNPGLGEMPSFSLPQDSRVGGYILETDGIPKRIVLTPRAIMIYDLWKGDGFPGDLSDFLEKAVIDLYNTRRPKDRSFG